MQHSGPPPLHVPAQVFDLKDVNALDLMFNEEFVVDAFNYADFANGAFFAFRFSTGRLNVNLHYGHNGAPVRGLGRPGGLSLAMCAGGQELPLPKNDHRSYMITVDKPLHVLAGPAAQLLCQIVPAVVDGQKVLGLDHFFRPDGDAPYVFQERRLWALDRLEPPHLQPGVPPPVRLKVPAHLAVWI